MKRFLVEAALLFFAVLGIMALAFRNAWARDTLRFARNIAWLYVALIILLSAFEVLRMLT